MTKIKRYSEEGKKKVFLGGTCNNSNWRDDLIPRIEIEYFNPVVEDWTPECQEREIFERKNCDYCLYVITPKMIGVYSIAEVVDDSNKRPDKTIFCFLEEDMEDTPDGPKSIKFTKDQSKSLMQTGKLVEGNGAVWCKSMEDVTDILNDK